MSYTIHTAETAPERAREVLEQTQKAYGFLPNLLGVMAEAPALLEAYRMLGGLFEQTTLTATERQIVLLAASYENECTYCMAAHSAIAGMQSVSQEVIDALRTGRDIPDTRLQALRAFAAAVTTSRGWPAEEILQAFFDAGYGNRQALEVILGIGMKTLSNYTNHLAETPLDMQFESLSWSNPA